MTGFRLRLSYLREHFFGVDFQRRRRLYTAVAEQVRNEPGGTSAVADVFLSDRLPCVFRGAAAAWSTRRWSPDFFRKNYGDVLCPVMTGYGLADYNRRDEYRALPLSEILDKKIYLRFAPLIAENGNLLSALDRQWLRSFRHRDSLSEAFHLFIGPRGSFTRLHAEMEVSLFVQCTGRKKWRLFAPAEYTNLYPSFRGRTHFVTEFDTWPGLKDFPLLQRAHCYETILGPGDVLYLPPFWWHYAENSSASVGVSYRFNAPTLALKTAPFLTLMRLMAYRPSVFYTLYHALVTKRNPLFEVRRGA